MLRLLRFALFPFSILYGTITWLRNRFFDWRWLPSETFPVPVITVGNLSTGGTGKTPVTEWIIRAFQSSHNIAVLSRGYGRKTSGYRLVRPADPATQTGDEPLQMARKFQEIIVAVDEDRRHGIHKILQDHPETDLIILDDAFQHRYVSPTVSILLTRYDQPYFQDFVLPAGNLRESRSGARRADLTVVTKCPNELSEADRTKIKRNLKAEENEVFFGSQILGRPIHGFSQEQIELEPADEIILITGIADGKDVLRRVEPKVASVKHMNFSDHKHYEQADMERLIQSFGSLKGSGRKLILTTEKDMVKWLPFQSLLEGLPVYYWPLTLAFQPNADTFKNAIDQAIMGKAKTDQ